MKAAMKRGAQAVRSIRMKDVGENLQRNGSSYAKGAFWLVIIVLVIVFGSQLMKLMKKGFDGFTSLFGDNEAERKAKADQEKHNEDRGRQIYDSIDIHALVFPESHYQAIADLNYKILKPEDSWNWTTDWVGIIASLTPTTRTIPLYTAKELQLIYALYSITYKRDLFQDYAAEVMGITTPRDTKKMIADKWAPSHFDTGVFKYTP